MVISGDVEGDIEGAFLGSMLPGPSQAWVNLKIPSSRVKHFGIRNLQLSLGVPHPVSFEQLDVLFGFLLSCDFRRFSAKTMKLEL